MNVLNEVMLVVPSRDGAAITCDTLLLNFSLSLYLSLYLSLSFPHTHTNTQRRT